MVNDGEWFYQQAGGRRLARLARGALVTGGDVQSGWIEVTLEGWIWHPSVAATQRAGFDLAVTAAPEENLRAEPAGPLVAKLAQGFLLNRVGEQGRWVQVRRTGWVKRDGLEATGGQAKSAAAAPAAPAPSSPAPSSHAGAAGDSAQAAVDATRAQPTRATPLFRAPEGREAGRLAPATPVHVLGRSGEWTRVQVEGWVRTVDLETATPGALVGVSAAELRAQPERYAGRVLRWTLQYLATQEADDLRPDMPRGGTYLLTRGPLPERGFVYVVVPEARRGVVEALAPLTTMQVTVRVRTGRSRFIGNPVVDLLTLEVAP